MSKRPSVLITELQPGAKVSGYVHACECCGVLFIASADARFCSNACRMRFSRSR